MNHPSVWIQTMLSREPRSKGEMYLRGYWLLLARVVCCLFALLCLALFIAAIPLHTAHLHLVCARVTCQGTQSISETARQLHEIGLSLEFYAVYTLALQIIFALVYFTVAAVIFWRKSNDWVALPVTIFLVTFVVIFTDVPHVLTEAYPSWLLPLASIGLIGVSAFPLCFYLFPDGRFAPRWTRWLLIGWIAWGVTTYFFPDAPFSMSTWYLVLESLLFVVGLGSLVFTQVYRYRYVSSLVQQQQTKWVVFGVSVGLGGFFVSGLFGFILPYVLYPLFGQSGSLSPALVGIIAITTSYLAMLLVPLSLGLAIQRHHLWDIDTIINRTLVYSVLTITLAALYGGSVIALQYLLHGLPGQEQGSQLVVVGSTLAIAALFQPLRRRIQWVIDRRFYRRQYDAAQTLAAFSETLREEIDLAQLREHLVAVVRETMQPTHVSLWLREPVQREEYHAQPMRPTTASIAPPSIKITSELINADVEIPGLPGNV